jgi:hypothetical protein
MSCESALNDRGRDSTRGWKPNVTANTPPDMKRSFCIVSVTGTALALPVHPEVNCSVTMSRGATDAICRGWKTAAMLSLHAVLPTSRMRTT